MGLYERGIQNRERACALVREALAPFVGRYSNEEDKANINKALFAEFMQRECERQGELLAIAEAQSILAEMMMTYGETEGIRDAIWEDEFADVFDEEGNVHDSEA